MAVRRQKLRQTPTSAKCFRTPGPTCACLLGEINRGRPRCLRQIAPRRERGLPYDFLIIAHGCAAQLFRPRRLGHGPAAGPQGDRGNAPPSTFAAPSFCLPSRAAEESSSGRSGSARPWLNLHHHRRRFRTRRGKLAGANRRGWPGTVSHARVFRTFDPGDCAHRARAGSRRVLPTFPPSLSKRRRAPRSQLSAWKC